MVVSLVLSGCRGQGLKDLGPLLVERT